MSNISSIKLYSILHTCSFCIGILIIILSSLWTVRYLGGFSSSDDPLHHFNYHPFLAILGLVVFYGEGLLLFRTLPYKSKPILKVLHSGIMFVVFILSVISLKCVFDSHDRRPIPIPNLYSLHSWLGLGTVILFAIQFLCGFLAFLYPGVRSHYKRIIMPYHRFVGTTIFILAALSCQSGITEKVKASLGKEYLQLPPAAYIANFLGVSIVLYAILVVYLVLMPIFKRAPLPEENVLELHNSAV